MKTYDIAIIGAGILGLAHALAAHRQGLSVLVMDRDAQSNGASVRNFGFVTITGQQKGECWDHARRSREVWAEIAPKAGIQPLHQGLILTARRPEAEAVIEEFLTTPMAEGCKMLTSKEAVEKCPALNAGNMRSALWSPHEIRVESRHAIPALTEYLAGLGVDFMWNTNVHAVETPRVSTSRGEVRASRVIVCPGDNFTDLFADRLESRNLTRCKLHMLRLRPKTPFTLGSAVMSDMSMVRYLGYSELPTAKALLEKLKTDSAEKLASGIHLIVVQSADGSLVVGDSHHYMTTPDPFQPKAVDDLILDEFAQVFDIDGFSVEERWLGTYASAAEGWYLIDRPDADTRLVTVTSGCGASTAFSIAEETISTFN